MKTHGRKTIYANYSEKEILNATEKERQKIIIDIVEHSIPLHEQNRTETRYLRDYLYGIQDIQNKEKKTRTDINHTSTENWAWAFCDWKKTFLLGKPIQYAPVNDVNNEEISKLNDYVTYENKQWLDQEIYEDIFLGGRGFRYINSSPISEDDEAPFDLINLDSDLTEVIYSSSIKHEQLLSYVETSKKWIYTDDTGKQQEKDYYEYTVYIRNKQYIIDNKTGNYKIKGSPKPIMLNKHIVVEYYINRRRMGLLEIVKDIFDDINYVENLDLDDIEAFVNSIMVFTNAEVTKESMDAIKEYGAVSIKSTDQKKASVEVLQSRLKSLDTQIYYLRKLSALHSILSVPQATQNGEMNAETGKAFLTGQGFTSASVRVEGEEQAFRKCDRNALKVILKICKESTDSSIKNLQVIDLVSKFSRDLSDNLVSKTTALLNLTTAQIPPEIRNQVIGLFSDPVSVTKLQKKYEEEREKIKKALDNTNQKTITDKINERNNNEEDSKNLDNQGQ